MATIDTTCPECSAPHARKLSLIHSSGLTATNAEINSVGKFNTLGGHKMTTKGTAVGMNQTEASRKAAPPAVDEISTLGTLVRSGVLLVGCAFVVGGFFSDSTNLALVGIVLIPGAFGIPTKPTDAETAAYLERTKQQREALERWERTFECG